MTDSVEVRLGAQTGDATSNMANAASSIDASLSKISQALGAKLVDSATTAENKVKAANKGILDSFLGLHEQVVARLGSINSAYIRFTDGLKTAAAVLAGGELGKKGIENLLEFENAVRGLQITMGMSSEKATQYALALRLAGSSAEAYEGMAQRVGRVLKTQSDEFDRLKVVYKDSAGALLPMDEILQNIYRRMQDFKAGTDQTEFALSTVGRNAKDFASDMQRLNATTERATQLQQQLGIEMGPERQAQVEQFRIEFNALKIAFEEISIRIGENLMPRLEQFAAWASGEGRTVLGYLEGGFKAIAIAVVIIGDVMGAVAREIGSRIGYIVQSYENWARVIKALATFDYPALRAAVIAQNQNMLQSANDSFQNIVGSAQKAAGQIAAIWSKVGPNSGFGLNNRSGVPPDRPVGSGNERFTFKPTGGAAGPTQLDEWKQQLEEMRLAEDAFHEVSKDTEAKFWAAKLQLTKAGTKDYMEVFRLMTEATKANQREQFATLMEDYSERITAAKNDQVAQLAIAHQRTETVKALFGEESREFKHALGEELKERQAWAEKEVHIADIVQKSMIAASKHRLDMARLDLDQEVALGQISVQQKLALEREYMEQERAIDTQAIRDRIALMASDPNADPVKLAELKAQLLIVEQTYQKQLTQIDNQAVLERQQFALRAADAIRSSMTDLLANLATGTGKFIDRLKSAFQSLEQSLAKIAADQVVKQFFGPGTSGGGVITDLTKRIFGGGATGNAGDMALQTAGTTLTTAGTTLEVSGTTLTTSGTLLQAAAAALQSAAAAMAGGGGGGGFGSLFGGGGGELGAAGGPSFGSDGGGIPSFDVGTPYVPRDMLAVVHKGEAIVPAKFNNPGGGQTINLTQHFAFSGPVDSRSQSQIAVESARAVRRAAQRAN